MGVLSSVPAVVVVVALTPPTVTVVVMMVLATTMIAIDTVAERPAGGGSVSVGGVVTLWRAAVESACAGPVATVVLLACRGRAAGASVEVKCITDVSPRVVVHDNALNRAEARPASPGPPKSPPTNDARPGDISGVAAEGATAPPDTIGPRQERSRCNEGSADHGGAQMHGGPSPTMGSFTFAGVHMTDVCTLPVVAVAGRGDGGPRHDRENNAAFVPLGSSAVAVHDAVAPMLASRAMA